MNKKRLGINLSLALALATVLLWVLTGQSIPIVASVTSELHVCPNSCAYSSIQDAVDAASDGDVIKVAVGTYSDLHVRPRDDVTTTGIVTQVVYVDKSVTIRGGYTTGDWDTSNPEANPTTLDAGGQGRVIYITGDVVATIEGLRITGGDATGQGGFHVPPPPIRQHSSISDTHKLAYGNGLFDTGGGIYIIFATVDIRDNQVFGNTAPDDGGGIYALAATVNIGNNRIFDNVVSGFGGGGGALLCNSNVIFSGNTVFSNTAPHGGGGGLYLHETSWYPRSGSNATLSANTFVSNIALGGGAIATTWNGYGIFARNTFTANAATWQGGGVAVYGSDDLMISGNTFVGNTAAEEGGGLYLWYSHPTLTNNVIADNRALDGGALYITASSPRLVHTTIARNIAGDVDGIVISDESTVAMTNTILVDHDVGISARPGATATLESTLWNNVVDYYGWGQGSGGAVFTGTHNYWGDPAFASDGYHLTPASLAIDRGIDAGITEDVDGDVRPSNANYDIGADELMLTGNQAPHTPHSPVPANGAARVLPGQVLSWKGGDPDGDVVTYTVILGTSSSPPVVTTTLQTIYAPALVTDTMYYWLVIAVDGSSTVVGPTWSFATTPSVDSVYLPIILSSFGPPEEGRFE